MEQFLPTLLKTLPDYAEAVVCDNASSDDSVSFMKEWFPQVRLLQNDRNEGFARGYNIALQQVEATYYCLLNSDIEVTDGWIEPVIEQMDANEKIAAVQPKLLSYARRDEFEYAGASGGFIDKYGYPFCRGRVFSNVEKDHGQYDTVEDIFWATGAAMFVRSDIYRTMGGLDDDFSPYANFADADVRNMKLGWQGKAGAIRARRPFRIDQNYPLHEERWKDDWFNLNYVGRADCNLWGLYDMHGNAAEWTRSDYVPYPYGADDGRNAGNAEKKKSVRGGSFASRPRDGTSSCRLGYWPWQKVFDVGFRVVLETSVRSPSL